MTSRLPLALALVTTLVGGCATVADLPSQHLATAQLSLPTGQPIGTAQVLADGASASVVVMLTGLPAGTHGIHLHTVGACRAPDFTSAGAHLNPLARRHGVLADGGHHAGDLPNITIAPGGSGSLTAVLSGTPAQVRDWLFDADGTAIVLHAAADDYRTDPTGNSGARIACGVFKPA